MCGLLLLGRMRQDMTCFARPEADGLHDGGWWNVDVQIGVGKVAADLGELCSVEEAIALGDEVGGGDEILNGGDDGFTVSRRDEVVLDTHEDWWLPSWLLQSEETCMFISSPSKSAL
ncbi:hypothetical protein L1887_44355 [Cichorium endivia]|nr:hypothetical protein L1887_44355 [Cichorium endivia]